MAKLTGELTGDPTIMIDGLELPILTEGRNGKKYNCYVEPLRRFKREMDAMLSHHNKVFILRFDVRVKTQSLTNEQMTRFMRSYVPKVERYYKDRGGQVGYVWCREVEKAKKQHYHCAIMVNGDATRVSQELLRMADEVAAAQKLNKIGYCDNASYLIKRTDLEKGNYSKYNAAFERLSYLAKERGKAIRAERANSFQTSRIKPRLNEHGEVFGAGDDYSKRIIVKADDKAAAPTPTNSNHLTDAERQLDLFAG